MSLTTILGWGPIEQHFERLRIVGQCTKTFDGRSHYQGRVTVWELEEPAFNALINDGELREEEWIESGAAWRHAVGSNQHFTETIVTVNGEDMWGAVPHGFSDEDETGDLPEYDHVFHYLCDAIGASTERNVTACIMDLAKVNDLAVGEFLTKYGV